MVKCPYPLYEIDLFDKNKEILFVPQTLYHGTPLQIINRFCKDYHLDTKTVKIFYLENTNER